MSRVVNKTKTSETIINFTVSKSFKHWKFFFHKFSVTRVMTGITTILNILNVLFQNTGTTSNCLHKTSKCYIRSPSYNYVSVVGHVSGAQSSHGPDNFLITTLTLLPFPFHHPSSLLIVGLVLDCIKSS